MSDQLKKDVEFLQWRVNLLEGILMKLLGTGELGEDGTTEARKIEIMRQLIDCAALSSFPGGFKDK